jgi:hypothetical protein
MARYYMLSRNQEGDPYVVAETCDEAWAKDEACTWHTISVLSEQEASLDPDWSEAVERWRARDDRAVEADEAVLAAEMALRLAVQLRELIQAPLD